MSAAGGPRALPPAARTRNSRAAAALEDLSRRARQAGRQLWLASLGAAASAADAAAGAPRVAERGRRLVNRLVERGRPLAERQAKRARARLGSLTDRAGRTVQSAADLARETAEYETRRLLHRFELATADDLRLLTLRLEALDQKLDDYRRRLAGTRG
jgi:Poly(hydroxyalcanoate) granule associated protein (phasin)